MENEQMKCGGEKACGEHCRCDCNAGECRCASGESCKGCESSCQHAD